MNKDNGIFILIGMIIGALIVTNLYFIFNKPQEPITFEIPKLQKIFEVDTVPYIIDKKDTFFIDSTTHLYDLPVRTIARECSNLIYVDKKQYIQPITTEAEIRGLLYSLKIEADPITITTMPKKKLDWKMMIIAFGAGFVLDRVILKR